MGYTGSIEDPGITIEVYSTNEQKRHYGEGMIEGVNVITILTNSMTIDKVLCKRLVLLGHRS